VRHFLLVILLFLVGCSPHSLEDFHNEGEAQIRKLIKELKAIHSREELQRALPSLQRRFDAMVDLMIEARSYEEKHPAEDFEAAFFPNDEVLLEELKRLYLLEGGRELMEKAEREALLRLDAFERTLSKRKERGLLKP
jgi:Tfp pilus assembly protein PilP